MDHSRSCETIPTGVKASRELGIATHKCSTVTQDTRSIFKIRSLEKLARTTQPCGLRWPP
eukprot:8468864-Pyramimonas_sp.AAC.1